MKYVILIMVFAFQFTKAQSSFSETSGDVLLFALPAISLSSSLILGDKQGTWQFTKGFLLNQAISNGLKFSIDKDRPNGKNNNSFPSAHTSISFHAAAFLHFRYGFKYAIPSYLLATYTGYTRIENNYHDITDVITGAVIGIGSAYLFKKKWKEKKGELTYSFNNDKHLLTYRYIF